MLVNQSLSRTTLALFQPLPLAAAKTDPAVSFLEPASSFSRAQTVDMGGFYSDPAQTAKAPGVLSQRTQDVLGAIQSLISKEVAAVASTAHAMWEDDVGRELPDDVRYRDLTEAEVQSTSRDTRDALATAKMFGLYTALAIHSETGSPMQKVVFGEDYLDMSAEELVEDTINGLVDMQINFIRKAGEMAGSAEVAALIGTQDRTALPELAEDAMATVREDLLAKRWAQYERGEIEMTVTVAADAESWKRGQAKTLDMADGALTPSQS